ncbi:hypothetical protein Tco_0072383 [Tanacetum coccineum]
MVIVYLERISKKRTKNEAKTTKPDSEWKSRKKTKSKSKPKPEKVNRKTIKECSSCGVLYTSNCGCSKGSLEDKILVPKPPRNCVRCARCGTPVDGPYCQGCALLRKEFMEGLLTNCVENEFFKDFQDTSESSDDNTNVVNAPREPIVVNQDPGENSSPSPPHIDHCCHECGDSLDGIFCRQCTCKSCGKGAHYGYNCPPRVPIISNPEPCKNQTIDEPLQNLQGLQQQCLLGTCQRCGCNEYNGVCFYCKVGNGTQINVSTPYSSNDSPSVANHPPQPQYVPYSSFKEHSETITNYYDDNSSSDDDSPYDENIDYVDASSPDVEIVSLEVVEIVDPEINSLRDNPTPSSEVVIKSTSTFPNIFLEETNTFDNSIPESETFRFNLDEIGSAGTDNQEKDEKQSQNDKNLDRNGKAVKDKAKHKP